MGSSDMKFFLLHKRNPGVLLVRFQCLCYRYWYVFAALYWKALCQCPPSSTSREVMSDTLSRSLNGILTEQRQQEEEELSPDHHLLKIHLHPWRIKAYPSQKRREHKVHPSSFPTSSVLAQYVVVSILKQVVKDCESWLHPETTYRRQNSSLEEALMRRITSLSCF